MTHLDIIMSETFTTIRETETYKIERIVS